MKIVRLTQDHAFKPFDCGEGDLNDFLLQDAKQYAYKYNPWRVGRLPGIVL